MSVGPTPLRFRTTVSWFFRWGGISAFPGLAVVCRVIVLGSCVVVYESAKYRDTVRIGYKAIIPQTLK